MSTKLESHTLTWRVTPNLWRRSWESKAPLMLHLSARIITLLTSSKVRKEANSNSFFYTFYWKNNPPPKKTKVKSQSHFFLSLFFRSENVRCGFEVQPSRRRKWAPDFALQQDRYRHVWYWRREGDCGQPFLHLSKPYALYRWKGPPWAAQGVPGTVRLWPLRCQLNRIEHLTTQMMQYIMAFLSLPLPHKSICQIYCFCPVGASQFLWIFLYCVVWMEINNRNM